MKPMKNYNKNCLKNSCKSHKGYEKQNYILMLFQMGFSILGLHKLGMRLLIAQVTVFSVLLII